MQAHLRQAPRYDSSVRAAPIGGCSFAAQPTAPLLDSEEWAALKRICAG